MTPRHFALQLTLLAAAVVPVLGGQQPVEQGFTSLFNGKDLTGWVYGKRANGRENKSGQGTRSRTASSSRPRRTAATCIPRKSTRTSCCGSTSS